MAKVIDIQDLPEEEIKLIKEFIEFLKERGKRKSQKTLEEERIIFGSWPLGTMGNLTRREIYDYL